MFVANISHSRGEQPVLVAARVERLLPFRSAVGNNEEISPPSLLFS